MLDCPGCREYFNFYNRRGGSVVVYPTTPVVFSSASCPYGGSGIVNVFLEAGSLVTGTGFFQVYSRGCRPVSFLLLSACQLRSSLRGTWSRFCTVGRSPGSGLFCPLQYGSLYALGHRFRLRDGSGQRERSFHAGPE